MGFSDKAKQGESGLADRYQFAVREARFGFPYENATDVCALVLKGERTIDGNTEDAHLWLNTGKFEPGDKEGTFAIHETQDPGKFFNRNSKLGRFLKSAFEVGVPLEENIDPSRLVHETRDALMWEGLILDIEEIEESGKFKQGPNKGEEWTSRTPLIRAFLGKTDGSAPSATAAATPAPATTASASNGTVDPGSFDTHMAYLEAFVAAGHDASEALDKEAFYAAKA